MDLPFTFIRQGQPFVQVALNVDASEFDMVRQGQPFWVGPSEEIPPEEPVYNASQMFAIF